MSPSPWLTAICPVVSGCEYEQCHRTLTWCWTGEGNKQPEINGCAQTYGYAEVGDVCGMQLSGNEGVGRGGRRHPFCIGKFAQERCHLLPANKTLCGRDNGKGSVLKMLQSDMIIHQNDVETKLMNKLYFTHFIRLSVQKKINTESRLY